MSLISNTINFDDHVAGLESMSDHELTTFLLEHETSLEKDFDELLEVSELTCGLESIIVSSEGKSDDILSHELNLLLKGYGYSIDDIGYVGGTEGIRDVLAKLGRGISDKVDSVTKSITDFRRNNLSVLGLRRKKLKKVLEQLKSASDIRSNIEIGIAASLVQSADKPVKSVADTAKLFNEWDKFFRDFQTKWLPDYEEKLDRVLDTASNFKITDPEGSMNATAIAALDLPFKKLIALSGAKAGNAKGGRRTGHGSQVFMGQGQLVIDVADKPVEKKFDSFEIKELIRQSVSQQAYFEKVKWPGKKPIELRIDTNSKKDVIELVEKAIDMLDFAQSQLSRVNAQGFGDNFMKTYGKLWWGNVKNELATGGMVNPMWYEYSKFGPRILVWQHRPRNSLIKHTVSITEGILRIGQESVK